MLCHEQGIGICCMKARVGIMFLVCWILMPCSVSAESARDLVASGNSLYAAGDYDKALEAYDQAATEQPDAGEPLFNKGNAYFQKAEFEKAREAYQSAALKTKDLSLEAAAHYNLGNTVFAEAQKQSANEPQKALSQFGQSIHHYQEALRLDPRFQEAAQNIEIARITMKDLADRIKKAEEAAKEQQKQRADLEKQLKEAIQEQESQIKENEALQQKAAQDPPESIHGEARQLASDQDKTRQKTQEIAEKLKDLQGQQQAGGQIQPQQPDDAAPSAQEYLDQAQEAQKAAVEKLQKPELDDAKQDQSQALEHLKKALAKSEDAKNQQGQCPNPQAGAEDGQKPSEDEAKQQTPSQDKPGEDKKQGAESPQQQQAESQNNPAARKEDGQEGNASKVAGMFSESPENILREEKENRIQLQRVPVGGTKSVDKDW
jgi:tetratricopeptide (TPR) repeat protein